MNVSMNLLLTWESKVLPLLIYTVTFLTKKTLRSKVGFFILLLVKVKEWSFCPNGFQISYSRNNVYLN